MLSVCYLFTGFYIQCYAMSDHDTNSRSPAYNVGRRAVFIMLLLLIVIVDAFRV